jgi:hypothetical protein
VIDFDHGRRAPAPGRRLGFDFRPQRQHVHSGSLLGNLARP